MKRILNALSRWRESLLLPFFAGLTLWMVLKCIFFLTGRAAVVDVGALADYVCNIIGVLLVVMLVGAIKGPCSLLPDADETDEKLDWRVRVSDIWSTVFLIAFLSWLVLR